MTNLTLKAIWMSQIMSTYFFFEVIHMKTQSPKVLWPHVKVKHSRIVVYGVTCGTIQFIAT